MAEQEEPQRPVSPYYWQLKKILDDAGVELVLSDRNVTPSEGREYADEDDGDEVPGRG